MNSAALPPLSPVETREGPLPVGADWEALVAADRPVLFKAAAAEWLLVRAGLQSPEAAADVLREAASGVPLVVYRAASEEGGRFFYNANLDGFNFATSREPLVAVLGDLLSGGAEAIYVGSSDLTRFFPRLAEHSGLDLGAIHPMLAAYPGLGSLWLGNRTTASCHYDFSNNIAVCAVGTRRFTLFPPDQGANLYPGPLDPTPGGQVVSMVDFAAPDLARFPRFSRAWEHGLVAEMSPGDVLVYPAMWWHHVEALAAFNVLINYWWNAVPGFIDSPQTTLLHALLSLRDRPAPEKAAWAGLFNYYVFGDADVAGRHLPDHTKGPLGPIDDIAARRLRALVQRKLQR